MRPAWVELYGRKITLATLVLITGKHKSGNLSYDVMPAFYFLNNESYATREDTYLFWVLFSEREKHSLKILLRRRFFRHDDEERTSTLRASFIKKCEILGSNFVVQQSRIQSPAGWQSL